MRGEEDSNKNNVPLACFKSYLLPNGAATVQTGEEKTPSQEEFSLRCSFTCRDPVPCLSWSCWALVLEGS